MSFGQSSPLAGVVSLPPEPCAEPGRPAVILLNAGATHRVGPSRLYVRLARHLAGRGCVVLRFDHSGIGDSPQRRDQVAYAESVLLETGEALDYLARRRGSDRFALTGICSGGATAFVAARRDPRVVGVLAINAQAHFHADHPEQVESALRRALSRHSLRIALFSSFRGKNLRKLLAGRLSPRRVVSMLLGGPARSPQGGAGSRAPRGPGPDPSSAARELASRGVKLLHVYSEGDEGLDYFRSMVGRSQARSRDGALPVRVLKGVDHLFTQRWSQDALVALVDEWMDELSPRRPA